ncbi:MAG: minichromosome maintenance protein MCM [Nitrososphaerales archaeon]|nr:minichromosome maintenance protein MCM [Nitrososphaerales archaeon]
MEQSVGTHSSWEDTLVRFIKNFKDKSNVLKYQEALSQMVYHNSKSLIVDYEDLLIFDDDLSTILIERPDEVLSEFNSATYKSLYSVHPEYAESIKNDIQVRLRSLPEQVPLRDISSKNLHRLSSVEGLVVRTSELKPLATSAAFACTKCGESNVVQQVTPLLVKPSSCIRADCSETKNFTFDEKQSSYQDYQLIRIQELPEELPPGQLPQSSDVHLTGDMVNIARPGDRLNLTGIVRIDQPESRGNEASSIFRSKIEGNYIDIESKGPEDVELTKDEEELIIDFAKDLDAYPKLIQSIAPNIQGLESQKEAVLLMLIGAPNKTTEDGSSIRGDINILFVGDPGTAKSELLKYASRLAPRGLYASGKGSTAAGLTAAVVRERTGMMMLEAGTVVLADKGIACIDEFDKMRNEDRTALHEAMEQQTVSVAKGGINATLNARTAVLAAANPELGRYDNYKTFNDQINIDAPLLTRFDLIFAIKDTPNVVRDEKLAQHILDIHETGKVTVDVPLEFDLLKKYISYAKNFIPTLSPEAKKLIQDYYVKTRQSPAKDEEGNQGIPITPRALEGMVRLASARARSLFRDIVTEEDAEFARNLVRKMYESVGTDPETGEVDFGIMYGKPVSERSKLETTMSIFEELQKESSKQLVDKDEFIQKLIDTGKFTSTDARKYFKNMSDSGQIYNVQDNLYRKVN